MTAAEYARLRGRSPAWVSGRIKAGLPHAGGGRKGAECRIDPARAIEWEIDEARFERSERGTSQRDRLAKEQADKVALENSVARGDHMLRSQVEPVLLTIVATLAADLDAIAGRLAGELAGVSDQATIRQRLLSEHRGVRAGLADALRKLAGRPLDAGEDRGGDDAAAAAKPGAVGGRKPNRATRKPRAGQVEK